MVTDSEEVSSAETLVCCPQAERPLIQLHLAGRFTENLVSNGNSSFMT